MNIFVLDEDPVKAAQMLCDQHIIKMPIESAQMLSTAHRILDNANDPILYKVSHKNHPCNVWVRSAYSNYMWLYYHYIALLDEYTARFGAIHGSACGKIDGIREQDETLRKRLAKTPFNIPYNLFQRHNFVLGFKNYPECVVENDPIQSYRNFYLKKNFKMTWRRNKPSWYIK